MRSKKNPDGSKKELSTLEIKAIKKAGLHAVGTVEGLCLKVDAKGNKSWVLRAVMGGNRRSMGLGRLTSINHLKNAGIKAQEARDKIAKGIDPIAERQKTKEVSSTITFGKASEIFITQKSVEWRNDKHISQWRNTLKEYCGSINSKNVSDIETHHIRELLEEIWLTKTETATRVRGRIETILDWATVSKYRKGENPARWKGHLEHLLASPKNFQKVDHHKGLPYKEIPSFVKQLTSISGVSSQSLEFLILTACRTSEVTNAKWSEIDLERGVWTIPAERMKNKKIFTVALSKKAIGLLNSIERNGDYVFSVSGKKPISNMAMSQLLKRMHKQATGNDLKPDYTVHGFRFTQRVWAAEMTNYSNDVCEAVLSHTTGSEVELTYKRTNFLEQRFPLMEDWSAYMYKAIT